MPCSRVARAPWLTPGAPLLFVVPVLLSGAVLFSGCAPKPVATINGVALSEAEFAHLCESATQINQQAGTVGMQVLARWIQNQVQAQEAKKLGLFPTEKDLNTRIEALRKQADLVGSPFDEQLRRQGLTLADFRRNVTDALVFETLMYRGITITEEEIVKEYERGKTTFTRPATANISQITLDSKAKLDEALNQLNTNAQFELVAQTHSKDPFAEQGGALPFPIREDVPPGGPVAPQVAKAVFKLKEGELTKPIQVGSTWVIAKLNKLTPKKEPVLEDVREAVRSKLIQDRLQGPEGQKAMQNQQKIMQAVSAANVVVIRPEYQQLAEMIKQQRGAGGAPGAGGGPAGAGGPGVPAGAGGPDMPPPPPSGN